MSLLLACGCGQGLTPIPLAFLSLPVAQSLRRSPHPAQGQHQGGLLQRGRKRRRPDAIELPNRLESLYQCQRTCCETPAQPPDERFPKRRGWDSNPRCPEGQTGFRDRRIQPLCHLSGFERHCSRPCGCRQSHGEVRLQPHREESPRRQPHSGQPRSRSPRRS